MPYKPTSWFPKWNPSGTAWKGRVQWLDDTHWVYNNGAGLSDQDDKPITSIGASEFTAGGGKWAVNNTHTTVVSDGREIPLSGSPTMNARGQLAWVAPRQADFKAIYLDGKKIQEGLHRIEPNLSTQLLVWRGPDRATYTLRLDLPSATPQLEPALRYDRFRPIAIDTPEGPYILNHTATGHVIVKAGTSLGWYEETKGESYYPDAIYRDGKIHVLCTTGQGKLMAYVYPLSSPKQDLKPLPPPPPPPPVEPPPVPDYLSFVKTARLRYNSLPAGKWRGLLVCNAAAWEMKKAGIDAGLLSKPSGSTSTVDYDGKHFPADIVVIGTTHYDCLVDGDGAATPTWTEKGPLSPGWKKAAPYDPAVIGEDNPPPPPPPPPPDTTTQRLQALEIQMATLLPLVGELSNKIDALTGQVSSLSTTVQGLLDEPEDFIAYLNTRLAGLYVEGRTSSSWGHNHSFRLPVQEPAPDA